MPSHEERLLGEAVIELQLLRRRVSEQEAELNRLRRSWHRERARFEAFQNKLCSLLTKELRRVELRRAEKDKTEPGEAQ